VPVVDFSTPAKCKCKSNTRMINHATPQVQTSKMLGTVHRGPGQTSSWYYNDFLNTELAWKLTQKVALTHNSVKNNECDWRHLRPFKRATTSVKMRHLQGMTFIIALSTSLSVSVITELCISATYRITCSSSGSSLNSSRAIKNCFRMEACLELILASQCKSLFSTPEIYH
jgi:hypothetical protein